MKSMNIEQQKMMRDYAWEYFSQHAEQRLKTFNFYVLFCTVVIGGFSTILSRCSLSISYIFMPLLLIFFSFIFWKLDQRTRMLINNGEDALKYLDSLALLELPEEAEILGVFARDDKKIETIRANPPCSGFFTYQKAFNYVFFVMSLVGVIGCLSCVMASAGFKLVIMGI